MGAEFGDLAVFISNYRRNTVKCVITLEIQSRFSGAFRCYDGETKGTVAKALVQIQSHSKPCTFIWMRSNKVTRCRIRFFVCLPTASLLCWQRLILYAVNVIQILYFFLVDFTLKTLESNQSKRNTDESIMCELINAASVDNTEFYIYLIAYRKPECLCPLLNFK